MLSEKLQLHRGKFVMPLRLYNWRAISGLSRDSDLRAFISIFKSYFPIYKYKYVIIFVLIGISSFATAMTAWLVRDVVNDFFVTKRGEFLIPLFLVIVAIFCAKGLSTYWQGLLSARIANDMVARTQKKLFAHILAQRIRFFERYSSDDLTMRVNQGAASFGSILNTVILSGARDLATVVSLLAVMVAQDLTLTLICLVAVPATFVCITMLLKKIKSLMHQEMRSIADLNKHVRELVQGVRVIKSYNLEPVIQADAETVIGSIQGMSNKISALQMAPIPIIDTLGGVGVGLTILYAGYRSIYENYDPGTFLSFVTALLLAMDPARRLSQLRVSFKTSLAIVGMVQSLLDDHDPDMTADPASDPVLAIAPEGGAAIKLHDVRFGYTPKTDVLKNFSLEVRPGEMLALVGPSGAGKSTVFSLLLRFHPHNSGTILVAGKNIESIPIPLLRRNIAYVGQSNFMFSGTIRDNLTLRREDVSQEAIERACETVGLSDTINRLPNRYDTPVGELGSLISGGQAQRLNIARSIIKDAPILLFDEVTSALDAENEELIRAYMHSQAGKKTILVIAHRLSTIRQADKIALIEDGQVKAFGTHQELMRGSDYYEKVATLQLIG